MLVRHTPVLPERTCIAPSTDSGVRRYQRHFFEHETKQYVSYTGGTDSLYLPKRPLYAGTGIVDALAKVCAVRRQGLACASFNCLVRY
eukprot:1595503-Rhodomonas_salina.1